MADLQTVDSIAVVIMIIIGIMFFLTSLSVFKYLKASCPRFVIRNGWALIQAFGVCMIIAGLYYFYCTLRGKCYTQIESFRTMEFYLLLLGALSLFILITGSVMLKEYDSLTDQEKINCDNENGIVKRLTMFITVLAGLTVLGAIGFSIKVYIESINIKE